MPTDDSGELAALKDLLQSEGWTLLTAHLDKTWGPVGYGWQMQTALATIPHGPDRAYELARVAEQVDATARAVNDIVAWPLERIHQLTEPAKPKRPFDAFRRVSR